MKDIISFVIDFIPAAIVVALLGHFFGFFTLAFL